MNIYTIGDSHSHSTIKNFTRNFHLGPVTMFRVGRDGFQAFPQLQNVPNDGLVLLSFGEIDIRCHVYNQIKIQGLDIDSVLRSLVDKYKQSIIEFSKIQIGILGIPPPCRYVPKKNNPAYPFVGSDEERLEYTLKMNILLEAMCTENKWIFVNVYPKYCDADGFLVEYLSDGNVHIANASFAQESLQNICLRLEKI